MSEISLQSDSFQCQHCGASLQYKPGTNFLHCDYCGNDTPIEVEVLQETEKFDFEAYAQNIEQLVTDTTKVIKCSNCGAESTFGENLKSVKCPYCCSPLVESDIHEERLIQPSYLLPFKVTNAEMQQHLNAWFKSLWFAPNKLKKQASLSSELQGVYIPCWVYDVQTDTRYTGQRGTTYTTVVGSGKNRRTVTRTSWQRVSGRISMFFDAILVTASRMVPMKVMDKIHNWDTMNMVEADNRFLSGFITEKYVMNVVDGYKQAQKTIDPQISTAVRRDIGGSQQRISSKNTQYSDVKFKLILLPVYISSYKFENKLFHFYMNGRTGRCTGDRPYSKMKIGKTVVLVIVGIVILYYLITLIAG